MNRVGLHLRLTDSLVDVAQQALDLSLPFFQSFLVRRMGKRYMWPTPEEERLFRDLCKDRFATLFAHGSFWINLSHTQYDNARALEQEIACAKRLGFKHIVVHAGCATGSDDRMHGIDALVRTINKAMRYERDIMLVLENTAHGNLSVGSDINDFALVREKIINTDMIRFCIDTAHAYSYGYTLETKSELDAFVQFLDKILDIRNIALIHLNDTCDLHGSCIDRHALVGTGGIGERVLRQFIQHDLLKKVPIILEPPIAPLAHVVESLHLVRQWHVDGLCI